jgi:predicted Zn finger-like uncharacterized protein
MDIACDNCKARFKVPDEKIPRNQVFAITCPRCKSKFSVDPRGRGAASPQEDVLGAPDAAAGTYDAADRPFDFLEEGAETALLCEPDPAVREQLSAVLEKMGYYLTAPDNARAVLKQMRYHLFDVAVVNERFDTADPDRNNILRFLERQGMETRREMFVAMLTNRFRTMDNMMAFQRSVNLVVNMEHLNDFEKILKRGLTDNIAFYKVFRDAMIKAGRA